MPMKTLASLPSAHPPAPAAHPRKLRSCRFDGPAVLAVGLTMSLALGGCARDDEADQFREGVPLHDDVKIVVPESPAQRGALTINDGVAEVQGKLLGDKAELYKLTRDITLMVNGGTVAVLGLVKTITDFPASSVATDVAVWGPHTDPLSPNTWRLTVHRLARGQFQYTFEAKPKTASDAAYVTVLSGHHNLANPGLRRRGIGPAFGSGDFDMDWDAAQTLPEHDDNVGKAHFVYSRPSATAEVNIDVTFTQVRDKDTGRLIDARYAFVESPGAGGSFQFTVAKDAILTTAAVETLTVRSRWLESGIGRSDVKLAGGDLAGTDATANECWDSNFASVYETNSYGDQAKMWGAQASCDPAFQTAEYAAF